MNSKRSGNDPRFMYVGVLSKFPIESIGTHIHERENNNSRFTLFSRDCFEYDIVLPADSKRLILFVNHFKSMYNPKDPCNGGKMTKEKRILQASRVRRIVSKQFPDTTATSQESPFAILGDFNDYLRTDPQGDTMQLI
jgi:hypothetical protein